MNNGSSVIRRPVFEKSNTELTNGLRTSLESMSEDSEDSLGQTDHNGLNHSDISTIYIPETDFSNDALLENRCKYYITVKFFFLPTTDTKSRGRHLHDGVDLVLKDLNTSCLDLLIVSFPEISFDADDDEDEGLEEDETQEHLLTEMVKAWRSLEGLHDQGLIRRLGLAEFSSERLTRFLPRIRIRPTVDQINVRDCCVVPKSLILYAKQKRSSC